MLHKSTIKAAVKKAFTDVTITEVGIKKFGIFVVNVSKEMKRSTKKGFLMGETDFDKSENGVVLESKINWI